MSYTPAPLRGYPFKRDKALRRALNALYVARETGALDTTRRSAAQKAAKILKGYSQQDIESVQRKLEIL